MYLPILRFIPIPHINLSFPRLGASSSVDLEICCNGLYFDHMSVASSCISVSAPFANARAFGNPEELEHEHERGDEEQSNRQTYRPLETASRQQLSWCEHYRRAHTSNTCLPQPSLLVHLQALRLRSRASTSTMTTMTQARGGEQTHASVPCPRPRRAGRRR